MTPEQIRGEIFDQLFESDNKKCEKLYDTLTGSTGPEALTILIYALQFTLEEAARYKHIRVDPVVKHMLDSMLCEVLRSRVDYHLKQKVKGN